ncbi:MAG: hypothetical protein P8177_04970 [Gemmatimonadota bacterium]
MAVSGPGDTLEQLQEGKLDTLVIARGLESSGGRCGKCGFVLERASGSCPYCGGELHDGVDLAEEMVRMAQDQGITIEFVAGSTLDEYRGAGGLLRF